MVAFDRFTSIHSSFAILVFFVLRTLGIVHSESVTFRDGRDVDSYVQLETIGEKAALRATTILLKINQQL